MRLHFYFLLFIRGLRAWENVAWFVLAEAVGNYGTVWFFLFLFLLFLHHLLVDAVSDELWVFVTAVVIADVLFLWERIEKISFEFFDWEIFQFDPTPQHINASIANLNLIIHFLLKTPKLLFQIIHSFTRILLKSKHSNKSISLINLLLSFYLSLLIQFLWFGLFLLEEEI